MAKISTYKVWYSNNATTIVKAKSASGARQQAWRELRGGYTYGWTRSDFLRNATVKRLK